MNNCEGKKERTTYVCIYLVILFRVSQVFALVVLILDNIMSLCRLLQNMYIRLSKPRVLKRQMSMVFCLIGLMICLVCPLESSLSSLKFTALEGNLTLKAYTTSSLQVTFKNHRCI